MSDNRATCWSVTINNPTSNDDDAISNARQKGWKVIGGLEGGPTAVPPTSTVHYQLCVKTPQVRFSAMKKAFPRANIQVARNVAALEQYVQKEETRIGDLPQTESKFPSQQGFYKLLVRELFDVHKDYRIDMNTGEWIRSLKGIDREQRLLDALDLGTSVLIRKGYHVENIVVNPQTRSAWKRFGMEVIFRTMAEMDADRQTDRQPELISRGVGITNDAASKQDPESISQQDTESSYDEDSLEESDCSTESGSQETSSVD